MEMGKRFLVFSESRFFKVFSYPFMMGIRPKYFYEVSLRVSVELM